MEPGFDGTDPHLGLISQELGFLRECGMMVIVWVWLGFDFGCAPPAPKFEAPISQVGSLNE